MLIHCNHCGQPLQLPDDKIPPGPFSVGCPKCKGKIRVEPPTAVQATESAPPAQQAPAELPASEPAATEAPPAPETAPAPPVELGPEGFEKMLPLRKQEIEIMERVYPAALLVDLVGGEEERLESALRLLEMREIQRCGTLEEAAERLAETEFGLLLIRMERAPAPPAAPLAPIYGLAPGVRRRTFVALMADNVRSLDGQVAFYLQVNCLIASGEMIRLPSHLRRAMLFHRRLYRYWPGDEV